MSKKRYDEFEYLDQFGYGDASEVSLAEIQIMVEKYKEKGYTDFKVYIDYGYYEGEEHLALCGKKE